MRIRLSVLAVLLLAAPPGWAQEPVVSTSAESRSVSLTVYNQGFAIVRERRDVALAAGMNRVRYQDVAQLIEPATVSIQSASVPGGVSVREQNYQYDLIGTQAILEKSVGRTVRFRRVLPGGGVEVVEGTLLSAPSQGIVVRTTDGRLLLNPEGAVEVAEMPGGLISRPSLFWLLQSARAGTQTLDVSYLTQGIGWSADYVAVIDSAEASVDLTGWVTLNNRSGTTYPEAQLQLLAGNVRRVTPMMARRAGQVTLDDIVVTAAPPPPQFAEEAFFEYHLYTLDGRTTLANNETKQMTLLSAADAGVTRQLVFDSQRHWGWYAQPGAGFRTEDVRGAVMLQLRNSQSNRMGMPLPAGVVRLYKADARGNLQFLGEDRIEHTPRDEMVRLYVGDAFDVVATRRTVTERQLRLDREGREIPDEGGMCRGCRHAWEFTQEIVVRNRKDSPADVLLTEHLGTQWRLMSQSHPHRRSDASTLEFELRVPARAEVTVTYTARI
ncbi:DUF4139 domain-containing protein [Longimicrobium sp.]|uniref:DUF4139 domain-containing protein n=1 Tax=Longimicrobium sp. TaxID=2029185 RepID=UPI003B3A51AE